MHTMVVSCRSIRRAGATCAVTSSRTSSRGRRSTGVRRRTNGGGPPPASIAPSIATSGTGIGARGAISHRIDRSCSGATFTTITFAHHASSALATTATTSEANRTVTRPRRQPGSGDQRAKRAEGSANPFGRANH
jgi:hypothetical protein